MLPSGFYFVGWSLGRVHRSTGQSTYFVCRTSQVPLPTSPDRTRKRSCLKLWGAIVKYCYRWSDQNKAASYEPKNIAPRRPTPLGSCLILNQAIGLSSSVLPTLTGNRWVSGKGLFPSPTWVAGVEPGLSACKAGAPPASYGPSSSRYTSTVMTAHWLALQVQFVSLQVRVSGNSCIFS